MKSYGDTKDKRHIGQASKLVRSLGRRHDVSSSFPAPSIWNPRMTVCDQKCSACQALPARRRCVSSLPVPDRAGYLLCSTAPGGRAVTAITIRIGRSSLLGHDREGGNASAHGGRVLSAASRHPGRLALESRMDRQRTSRAARPGLARKTRHDWIYQPARQRAKGPVPWHVAIYFQATGAPRPGIIPFAAPRSGQ